MSSSRLWIVIACAALAIWSPSTHGADEETAALIARINAAWEAREASIKTFDANWIQRTTQVADTSEPGATRAQLPEMDNPVEFTFRFVCNDNMARLERKWREFDFDRREYLPKSLVRAFDGRGCQEIFDGNKPGQYRKGWVDRPVFEDTDWRIHPLVFAFRPASWMRMGAVKLESGTVKKGSTVVEGVNCHVFSTLINPSNPGVFEIACIADAPDFRMMRRELVVRGLTWQQITVVYENISKWGNICKGWTIVDRNSIGEVVRTSVVSKVEIRIGEPVQEQEFVLTFPPGTVMYQERTKVYAIVRADGTFRPVARQEYEPNILWSKILNTDPPPEAPKFNIHEP